MEQPHGGRKAGKRNCLYLGFSIILGPPLLTLSCDAGLSGERFEGQGEIQEWNVGVQIFICSIAYMLI